MQCGEVLPEGANLVYKRLGKLSPQKDNVILHPTSFDANHEDLLYKAGDISRNEQFSGDLGAALAAITARTLVMPCSTDRYFTEEEVRDEVAMMDPARAMLAPIVSDWGHRAGDPHRPGQEADAEYLRQHVHDLLARLD